MSTVVVGAGGVVAGVPVARVVVVATGEAVEAPVVVVTLDTAIVGGTEARSDTSVWRSSTSSRNWMISARIVSISSVFDSNRPQPVPMRARANTRASVFRIFGICMRAVFQRNDPKTSHLAKFFYN